MKAIRIYPAASGRREEPEGLSNLPKGGARPLFSFRIFCVRGEKERRANL